MKNFMDNIFICAGFNAKEVQATEHRIFLYMGMVLAIGLTIVFITSIFLPN